MRTVDAGLTQRSNTRYDISCGVHGCPEALGQAVRGDELVDYAEQDKLMGWYLEQGEGIGHDVMDISPQDRAHTDPKAWYLLPPVLRRRRGSRAGNAPEKRYRVDEFGEVHVVGQTRPRTRRPIPEGLEAPPGIEAPRETFGYDSEAAEYGIIGQRPDLPRYVHCSACKKRGVETRNWVRKPL